MTNDQLTVGQAAQRLGVTVRTLHHWDAEGLAQPSARSAAGYRLYTQADLDRSERVVLYRELGLGLNAMCGLLHDPDMDAVATLPEQSAQTEERIHRLQQLHRSPRDMIEAHERGPLLGPERQEEVLGEGWNPDWPAQSRARWGNTAQWRQYAERAIVRTPEGWTELMREAETLDDDFVQAVHDRSPRRRPDKQSRGTAPQAVQPVLSPHTADAGLLGAGIGVRPGVRCALRRAAPRARDVASRAHGSTGLTPTLPVGSDPARTRAGVRPRGGEPRA